MIFQIFFGAVLCFSTSLIYSDYCKRRLFKNIFLKQGSFHGRKITTGIISKFHNSKNINQVIDTDYYALYHKVESIIERIYFYDSRWNIIRKFECWKPIYNIYYNIDYLQISDVKINFNSKSEIFYSNNINKIDKTGKLINISSIPINSQITIFGTPNYEHDNKNIKICLKYDVDIIGPKEMVMKRVAEKYFDISDNYTIINLGIFFISSIMLIETIMN